MVRSSLVAKKSLVSQNWGQAPMCTLYTLLKRKVRWSIFNPKRFAAIATSMDIDMQSVKKFVHCFSPCIEKVNEWWYGRKCQGEDSKIA